MVKGRFNVGGTFGVRVQTRIRSLFTRSALGTQSSCEIASLFLFVCFNRRAV